jgi:transposase
MLSQILGIKQTRVCSVSFEDDGVVAEVAPTTRVPRCSGCGCRTRAVYDGRERSWRHPDLAGMRVTLRYRLRRVNCPRCGVVVELVPWAQPGSWFTTDFEDMVGYLAQHSAKTVVAEMMRIAWRTVGEIVQRVVARLGPRDLLDGLTHIGVDELSYRRHHEYITVIVDHRTGRVVWAARGKNAETLKSFFRELGAERCGQLEAVTIDMSAAYIAAVTEASPQAKIIFDKFHVQRLAHDALDEVRRAEVRESRDPEVKAALKPSRFALQKNPWNLNDIEQQKVSQVQQTNRPLYRAYLLKESLAAILARRQPNVARQKLLEWADWGTRSQLRPFVRVAKTVRKHLEGIVAYVASGLTNARSEGMNGKARTITRRSYGFHSASSLIAMLFLCCSWGIPWFVSCKGNPCRDTHVRRACRLPDRVLPHRPHRLPPRSPAARLRRDCRRAPSTNSSRTSSARTSMRRGCCRSRTASWACCTPQRSPSTRLVAGSRTRWGSTRSTRSSRSTGC